MRATRGDPEDMTPERMPFILEKVKLAAGEFAAAVVRAEADRTKELLLTSHAQELEWARQEAEVTDARAKATVREVNANFVSEEIERQALAARNLALQSALHQQQAAEVRRQRHVLRAGFAEGVKVYKGLRWTLAVCVGFLSGFAAHISVSQPVLSVALVAVIGFTCFWFVPELLDKPLNAAAAKDSARSSSAWIRMWRCRP